MPKRPRHPTPAYRQSVPERRIAYDLGPMPAEARAMLTVDERVVRAPLGTIFELARRVDRWPEHLAHYRFVRYRERSPDGGGVVEMSAFRPFGPLGWPTWWASEMAVYHGDGRTGERPRIRFRHVGGITTGMDVEWSFDPAADGVLVRIVHAWDGPRWPLIGRFAAVRVIGPIFVHGIASRTLAGLAEAAEKGE
ncbi:MAG TPA: SRPBCC family protein [Gemmatimonadaceae bacterium]|nr:SRPBCC family protein [Gemmatimonadaceae bacterium]